jgi:ribonuclease T2
MLDIMPSATLVQHEWAKHGTCSGLSPEAYFEEARMAFTAVTIPASYRDPLTVVSTAPRNIKDAFREANPSLTADRIAVLCKGKFLQEVRICLAKDLEPRSCGRAVRDNCGDTVIVRPVK